MREVKLQRYSAPASEEQQLLLMTLHDGCSDWLERCVACGYHSTVLHCGSLLVPFSSSYDLTLQNWVNCPLLLARSSLPFLLPVQPSRLPQQTHLTVLHICPHYTCSKCSLYVYLGWHAVGTQGYKLRRSQSEAFVPTPRLLLRILNSASGYGLEKYVVLIEICFNLY